MGLLGKRTRHENDEQGHLGLHILKNKCNFCKWKILKTIDHFLFHSAIVY